MMKFNPTQSVWFEKYRPLSIADCILPDRIKKPFEGFLKDSDFPSLLLSGSAGVGKTTIAKALCNDLGVDMLFINASSERGIDVLRNDITNFASTVSFNDAPFKVVLMDEFDQATNLLQTAMRAAIEEFATSCRFIFTCNFPNNIIEPIHSRCSTISFNLEGDEKKEMAMQFMKRLCEILKNEDIKHEKPAVAELIKKHFPDFRRVINELQKISKFNGEVTLDVVTSLIENVSTTKLLKHLKARDFSGMRQWVAQNASSDSNAVFRQIYDGLKDFLQPSSIPEAIIKIAEYQHRGTTAPDAEINLAAFFVEIMTLEFKND